MSGHEGSAKYALAIATVVSSSPATPRSISPLPSSWR
jgi:hypothetical protein